LLMLFDEIWFLSRSLCPQNMRDLPYVRFMDESGLLPLGLRTVEVPDPAALSRIPSLQTRSERLRRALRSYGTNVKRIGIHWDAIADHHTDRLDIDGRRVRGDSLSLWNVLFDLEIVNKLN